MKWNNTIFKHSNILNILKVVQSPYREFFRKYDSDNVRITFSKFNKRRGNFSFNKSTSNQFSTETTHFLVNQPYWNQLMETFENGSFDKYVCAFNSNPFQLHNQLYDINFNRDENCNFTDNDTGSPIILLENFHWSANFNCLASSQNILKFRNRYYCIRHQLKDKVSKIKNPSTYNSYDLRIINLTDFTDCPTYVILDNYFHIEFLPNHATCSEIFPTDNFIDNHLIIRFPNMFYFPQFLFNNFLFLVTLSDATDLDKFKIWPLNIFQNGFESRVLVENYSTNRFYIFEALYPTLTYFDSKSYQGYTLGFDRYTNFHYLLYGTTVIKARSTALNKILDPWAKDQLLNPNFLETLKKYKNDCENWKVN